VAVALEEIKSGNGIRTAEEVGSKGPPSKKGGKVAAQVSSASAIVKVLSGIDFPKSKDGIKKYARNNLDNFSIKESNKSQKQSWIFWIEFLKKQYSNMADVEREAVRVL
jgi:hypothetical protein